MLSMQKNEMMWRKTFSRVYQQFGDFNEFSEISMNFIESYLIFVLQAQYRNILDIKQPS